MFAQINILLFLLIFLVYVWVCAALFQRRMNQNGQEENGLLSVKCLLFCTVVAMLLTVLTIYLWFLVLILTAVVLKYVWGFCMPRGKKAVVVAILVLWMAVVGAAGFQLMQNMDSDEEEDDASDFQDFEETEDSIMMNGAVVRNVCG